MIADLRMSGSYLITQHLEILYVLSTVKPDYRFEILSTEVLYKNLKKKQAAYNQDTYK